MSKYTLQILPSKEFDNLPYNNIKDSLGLADREKGLAFVRETGVEDWDRETLLHEIDHLVEKNTTHEDEFGICHKSGSDTLKNVIAPIALNFIPGIGTALSAMYSAGRTKHKGGSWGDALKAGAMSYGGGKLIGGVAGKVGGKLLGNASTATTAGTKGLIGQGGSLFGMGTANLAATGGGGGLSGALGSMAGGPSIISGKAAVQPIGQAAGGSIASGSSSNLGAMNLLGNAGLNLASSGAKSAGSVTPNTSSLLTPNTFNPTSNVNQSSIIGGGGQIGQSPAAGNVANNPNAPATQAPATQEVEKLGFGDQLKANAKDYFTQPKNLLGIGQLAASSMTPAPEFQMPASVEDIRSKLLAGGQLTEQGQLAASELKNILQSSPEELYPTANDEYIEANMRQAEESRDLQKKQIDARYNQAGVLGSGEHLAALDKLDKDFTQFKTDFTAQANDRRFELARTAKYQAIQDSLNVDKQTMDNLVGLTGMDVTQAAIIYGAEAKDVKAIREALGTMGSELLISGQPQVTGGA